MRIAARLEPVVEGVCRGRALVVRGKLSFYGEVDPVSGVIRGLGVSVAGRVLFIEGTRGSTVGPYVMYALRRRGAAPACIVSAEIEPLLVVGAVISETPLYRLLDPYDAVTGLVDGRIVGVAEHGDEVILVVEE